MKVKKNEIIRDFEAQFMFANLEQDDIMIIWVECSLKFTTQYKLYVEKALENLHFDTLH